MCPFATQAVDYIVQQVQKFKVFLHQLWYPFVREIMAIVREIVAIVREIVPIVRDLTAAIFWVIS